MHRLFEEYDDADKVNAELKTYVKSGSVDYLIDQLLNSMTDSIEDSSVILGKIKRRIEMEGEVKETLPTETRGKR